MRYANVKLIVAIGNYGQIGRAGRLPWHDPADLRHFERMTEGDICIVGRRTFDTLPELPGRDVVRWERNRNIHDFVRENKDRVIWVCGGAAIYKLWLPHVSMSLISHIDHDTKGDVYMPFLWRYPSHKRTVERC